MSTHDADGSMSRRAFVGAATGGAALSAAGGAVAQEQEGTTSGEDAAAGGTEEVVVGPGGSLVYEPADLEITPGTTVNFVWDSDNHNIVVDSQPDGAEWEGTPGSDTYDTGYEYSHTFETEGEYAYYCQPHLSAGMEASITVSADAGGGGAGRPTLPDSALTMGVTTIGVMASTLALAFFFLKYGGDYEGAQ
jgi:plastocyanin